MTSRKCLPSSLTLFSYAYAPTHQGFARVGGRALHNGGTLLQALHRLRCTALDAYAEPSAVCEPFCVAGWKREHNK
jgi:hypothetical protein